MRLTPYVSPTPCYRVVGRVFCPFTTRWWMFLALRLTPAHTKLPNRENSICLHPAPRSTQETQRPSINQRSLSKGMAIVFAPYHWFQVALSTRAPNMPSSRYHHFGLSLFIIIWLNTPYRAFGSSCSAKNITHNSNVAAPIIACLVVYTYASGKPNSFGADLRHKACGGTQCIFVFMQLV